jgi:ABC-2 type transport system permease protein
LIFGCYAAIIYFSVKNTDKLTIAIADDANVFNGNIKNDSTPSKDGNIQYQFVKKLDSATLAKKLDKEEFNGYVHIPAGYSPTSGTGLKIYYGKTIGVIGQQHIKEYFNDVLEERKFAALNISQAQLDSARSTSSISFQSVTGGKDKTGISTMIGFVTSFLIYIVLFIYGTMVMRGVMEEKVSRIAEVIVSSVKPFQLMMGKIIGIGAVGLLQFLIWITLVLVFQVFISPLLQGTDPATVGAIPGAPGAMAQASQTGVLATITAVFSQINVPLILGCFLFYFLGGYLLYSALFAAVGSAVNEDPQDAQSLILPITMPIIFGIVIMTKTVGNPTSGLAVFGSLFPLTSPIVMMARVAHGIPNGVTAWELILSMVLLIAGFVCTTWLASKIYRTGILLYGKKPTWKEMMKWAVRKN